MGESSTHDSMYIVKADSVVANKFPYEDLDSGNWVEFKAPQGEKGATGNDGKDAKDGNDGMGLKYVQFKLHDTYTRGNYVFSRSSESSTHDSMYIVKADSVVANKFPY